MFKKRLFLHLSVKVQNTEILKNQKPYCNFFFDPIWSSNGLKLIQIGHLVQQSGRQKQFLNIKVESRKNVEWNEQGCERERKEESQRNGKLEC